MNSPLYTNQDTPPLTFPLPEACTATDGEAALLPQAAERGQILLLEDDPFFGQFLQGSLLKRGFDVQLVNDGKAGLCAISERAFDVIISDIILPGLTGIDLYFSVRDSKPALCERFIFITGSYSEKCITEFIKSINGTLLYKPFHIDQLLQYINELRTR